MHPVLEEDILNILISYFVDLRDLKGEYFPCESKDDIYFSSIPGLAFLEAWNSIVCGFHLYEMLTF